MGVGAGLSMYVVVVQKFTFAISSPDEFLFQTSGHREQIDVPTEMRSRVMACIGSGEIGPRVHGFGYENCGGPAVLEAKVMGKPQEWLEP